jgi:antitoxin (DNA-binding transcriptional repressor) of toxin-antitoxin stability system
MEKAEAPSRFCPRGPEAKIGERPRSSENRPGSATMTLTVKIGEAKTHLSELLAKVEAGEEIIIARGNAPIAKLSRIRRTGDIAPLLAEIRAARAKAKPITSEEILAWRHEGHRF